MDEAAVHEVRTAHQLAGLRVDDDHDHHHAVGRELAPVPQHLAAHVADPQTVHERHPRLDPVRLPQLLTDLDDVAVLADERALGRDADLVREPRVMLEMAPLAVDGDEPAGPHEREHQPELFLGGVTGGVDGVGRHVEHVGARSGRGRRPRDGSPARSRGSTTRTGPPSRLGPISTHLCWRCGHEREGGVRLPLGTGADHDDAAGIQPVHLRDVHHVLVVDVEDGRAAARPRRTSAWIARGTPRPARSPVRRSRSAARDGCGSRSRPRRPDPPAPATMSWRTGPTVRSLTE